MPERDKLVIPESEWRAWMAGRKFYQKNELYEVVESGVTFVEGRIRNIIRFVNLETGVIYEKVEEEFFDKVYLMNKV